VGIETERRFLPKNDIWRKHIIASRVLEQGYLNTEKEVAVRIRKDGNQAYLTIKTLGNGISRHEFEYNIPKDDADQMLASLCANRTIQKTRHMVPWEDHTWEIDVFDGENSGLVICELELKSESETFTLPPWAGEEITGVGRYSNAALARNPFSRWQQDNTTKPS
jgi:adenylate cyclase